MREVLRRHRRLLVAAVVAGLLAAVFVAVWFQPQKLIIDETVSEPAATPLSGTPAPEQTTAPAIATVADGSFTSLEHDTTGTALLQRLPDGSHLVRFEALNTSNGPDLRVYLSKLPAGLGWRDYGREFIELGRLKGNIGDQNYAVPSGTDVSQFRSVVIWCKRFSVGFGVAQFA